MNKNGELKMIGVIVDTLGIGGLREMSYNISKTNAVINFCHDHPPPTHPRGFALKTLPHSGAFAS